MDQSRHRTNASTGMDREPHGSHAANHQSGYRRRRHRSGGSSVEAVIQTDLSGPPGWVPHLLLPQYGGPGPGMLPPPPMHSPGGMFELFTRTYFNSD